MFLGLIFALPSEIAAGAAYYAILFPCVQTNEDKIRGVGAHKFKQSANMFDIMLRIMPLSLEKLKNIHILGAIFVLYLQKRVPRYDFDLCGDIAWLSCKNRRTISYSNFKN